MKKVFPWSLLIGCVLFVAYGLKPLKPQNGFDSNGFGRLPVLVNGRIKPFDTVARTSLLIIRGKQTFQTEDGRQPDPTEWLLEVMMRPQQADRNKIFRIDHPDILGLFGWQQAGEKYFSFRQLAPFLDEVERQGKMAGAVESQLRSPFQKEISKLYNRLGLYHRLKNSLRVEGAVDFHNEVALYQKAIAPGADAIRKREAGQPFNRQDLDLILGFADRYDFLAKSAYVLSVPPLREGESPESWVSIGQSLLETMKNGEVHPAVHHYAVMASAYENSDPQLFNQALSQYRSLLNRSLGKQMDKVDYEFLLNHFEPFYRCMVLYVLAFLLAWISWLVWPETLGRSSFYILLLAFAIHTLGLVSRMYLQGRPPVTNLYSSAIFVGWGAVLLSVILEKIHRNSIGNVTAGSMGFLTLLIAHHLSADGDTMEMLRAVLDTNYWLATHVVVVTSGYASTFLAGFLAIIYIFRNTFTKSFSKEIARSLTRMVYGIVCFATLFSFVGTMLGGLWADQSWGRFWGWDPKENGALLIVLWNAIILHARWGGYIRERGLMVMAVFGNIVTSFSWFGVNMLGIGLHSYGFMDQAFVWLVAFDLSQVVIMIIGMIPERIWQEMMQGKWTVFQRAASPERPD